MSNRIGFLSRLSSGLLLVFALLLPAGAHAAGEAKPARVAVLPFTVNASGQMDYLVKGIRVMLGSRLTAGDGVLLVEPADVDKALSEAAPKGRQDDYFALARRLGADYLISGSLTAMGGGASLDATVFAAKGGQPQRFFATAAKENDVIPAVDELARDIGAKVLGQKVANPAAPAPAGNVAPAMPAAEQSPYTTAHPDKLLLGTVPGQGMPYYQGSPFIRPESIASSGFTKSQNLSFGLRAMAVGDVDGDGQLEVVMAEANKVHIYRRDQNRLVQVGEASTPARYVIHYISVADVNKNGRAEIYVSAADTHGPRSLALEWDGKQFAQIFKDQPWYIRAVKLPGRGEVLAGQAAGMNDFMAPGIYQLTTDGHGGLTKGTALDLPNTVNLFDFTYADVNGDGKDELVMIDQEDHLVVMSQGGKRLWTSDDNYGGTIRYLGGTDTAKPGALDESLEVGDKRYYVPGRIAVRDINGDGKPDLIVIKNLSTASRLLSKIRYFPSSEVHALTWNGIGMTELWHTNKIDGYIADLQLGPDMSLQGPDGKPTPGAQLFVGVVLRKGELDLLSSSESTVLTYQVPEVKQTAAAK